MTIKEILAHVVRTKPMTRESLYTHLKRARIKPISRVRQIPQHYPADAGDRVLARLGFKPSTKNGHAKR